MDFIRNLFVVAVVTFLSGCAATNVAINHHKLAISTKMSESIFLSPTDDEDKTVYISIRNASGSDVHIPAFRQNLIAQLEGDGYRVVKSTKKSHFMLQVNVLRFGESNLDDARDTLGEGFGGALSGGLAGAVAGGLVNNSSGALAGGLIGGAAGFVANTVIQSKTFVMVTDVQLAERVAAGQTVTKTSKSNMSQGSQTKQQVEIKGKSNWQYYRTRVVSTAEKMNLTQDKALDGIIPSLSSSLAAIL